MRALLAVSLVLSVIAFAPSGPESAYAAGATYYVAKTGSDSTGTGSSTNPWATIQKAVNSVSSGDTVRVAAGTYNERVTIPSTKSGTAATTTKLVADGRVVVSRGLVVQSNYTDVSGLEITPGWEGATVDYDGHVLIEGSYNTLTNINVHDIAYTGTGISFGFNAAYNTVNGFKVSNVKHYGAFFIAWWDSVKGAGAHHNVLKNGTIDNFGGNAGVNMAGANNTLDNVEISGPSGWNNYADGDGIRFIGPNMTVRNSKVHILQQNDPLGTNQPHTDQMQFWKYADGLLIENSIIGSTQPGAYDAKKGSCLMAEVRAGDSVTFTIRNSVFLNTDAASYGGGLTATGAGYLKGNFYNNVFWTPGVDVPSGSVLRNNVFKKFATESTSLPIDSDYNVLITGSTKNTNEGANTVVVSDAGFVNPDISAATRYGIDADWHPRSTSVAVDRGAAAYAPATDMSGVSRDSRPDIGALEYVAAAAADTSAPTVSVTAPANGATVSGTVALAASANDNVGVSKVEFRVDGTLVGTELTAPYTGSWNASGAAAGSHTIQARAYDAAGNINNASISVNIAAPADTTAPVTTATLDRTATGGWYLSAPVVTLSANETASTYYKWDDSAGTWYNYTAPLTALEGSHTLYFRSVDVAGNTESTRSLSINVDSIAPDAPVLAASAAASSIQLAWSSPSDAITTRVLRSTTGWLSDPNDPSATLVYEGVGTLASDTAVVAGTRYYYTAFVRDAAGHWSAPGSASASLAATSVTTLNLTASDTTVKTYRSVTLRGAVFRDGVASVSDSPVTVWAYSSGAWKQIGTATYNSTNNRYEFRTRVKATTVYRMQCTDGLSNAVTSNQVTVTVVR